MAAAASISRAIAGAGGAGVLTAGSMLLEAACAAGWHGLLTRSVGPQIRGGEAAALLRVATHPVDCHDDTIDLLLAVDWLNAHRFDAELPLTRHSLVVSDPQGGEVPAFVRASGARIVELPMKELGKANPAWRANMMVLGAAACLLDLPGEVLRDTVTRRLGGKGAAAVAANLAAIQAGSAGIADAALARQLPAPRPEAGQRWLITGNEATGLGAIRGGIRFAAAYPITPASEILEWLAPNLAKVGGVLVQAEDELAAVNMIIGSSFGGVPALTATSGPGLSLMIEALGLAVAAEVPIVVTDVMRGGPSTGIPTKSEQADLNIAIYGLHGDAPHLVLAPQTIADCVFTTQWATYLAETLQTAAIVLSDQFLGQAQAAIERPADVAFVGRRLVAASDQVPYRRYALGGSGVSPMALPGTRGVQYTADGLTHTEHGLPTSNAADHHAQLDKRLQKLDNFAYGNHWATIEGSGDIAVLTWGSLTGTAREAIARARAGGVEARLIAPRLIAPTRPREMAAALAGVRRLLIVEQTHGTQFHRFLRAHYDLPADTQVLSRAGPVPIRPGEIHRALTGTATT